MQVVVVGGGVAGLGSALALAAGGHRVVVLERDSTPMPASAAEAFAWDRRGAPQVRHSHAFLARARNLLAARAPEVLAALLAAGATELRFADALPATLTDRDPRPGDDELVALACRRTTFEWVLRRCVMDLPSVELHDGTTVTGLLRGGSAGSAPVVRGVSTERGDVAAQLVVDASGPRSVSRAWLAEIGVDEPPPRVHDSRIVYYSRFYELRDGHDVPSTSGPVAGDLGFLKYAVFPGDDRTFSITLACPSDDLELRRALRGAEAFEAAAAQLAAARTWRDGRSTPITGVEVMAGLRNRRRTFVSADGAEPLVLRFVAVGDAAICTNPLYGRGCSLALVHAFELADAVAARGDDARALARTFHDSTRREIDPWFRAAVQQDEAGEMLRPAAAATATAAGTEGGVEPRAWALEVLREGLVPALRTSPTVFRAFLRWFNLLATPDALVRDPEVVAEVLQSYEARASHPPELVVGPASRCDLLAALPAPPVLPR